MGASGTKVWFDTSGPGGIMVWMAPAIAIIGLAIMFGTAQGTKAYRIAEICFFCGLLAFLLAFPWFLHLPPHSVR